MNFALVAVPHVIFIQDFFLLELFEAVVDGDLLVTLSRICLWSVNPICNNVTRQVLLDLCRCITLPHHIQDHILFAFLVVEEADIVFSTYLVKQI